MQALMALARHNSDIGHLASDPSELSELSEIALEGVIRSAADVPFFWFSTPLLLDARRARRVDGPFWLHILKFAQNQAVQIQTVPGSQPDRSLHSSIGNHLVPSTVPGLYEVCPDPAIMDS